MSLTQEHIDNIISRKHRPSTPGEILLDILEDEKSGLTITSFAEQMNISNQYVEDIISGNVFITDDLANRIGSVVGNGSELWLNLQEAVEVWDKHNTLVKENI